MHGGVDVARHRHEGARQRGKRRRPRRIGGDRFRVDIAEGLAVGRDAVGADVRRGREARAACDRDQLVQVVVAVRDHEVEPVDAVGHHPDAARHGAVLVERQAARVGREAERRALRADRALRRVPVHVGTGQLRELHAVERPRRRLRFARQEVLLDDLARRARGKRVARRGEVRARDRLRDRRGRVGNRVAQAVERADHPAARDDVDGPARARHAEYGEDVAHAVDDGHRRAGIARARLAHGLGDDAAHIVLGEEVRGRVAVGHAGRGARVARGSGAAAHHEREDGRAEGRRAMRFSSHRRLPRPRARPPSA